MGIEGGVVGGGAGGAPVSMELLQLIAADPVEFQRRMALIEQSKKDFDEQLEKNQLVGDILALRKEASEAVDKANEALESAKNAAALLLADAKTKADRLVADATTEAERRLTAATLEADSQRAAIKSFREHVDAEMAGVQAREQTAATMMADAVAKYAAVEPDQKMYQEEAAKAKLAADRADQAKADYEEKRKMLDTVAQQLARVLSGAA